MAVVSHDWTVCRLRLPQALLELLPQLGPGCALGLLAAAWPLAAAHADMKQLLILVLRKAMFQPDLGAPARPTACYPSA